MLLENKGNHENNMTPAGESMYHRLALFETFDMLYTPLVKYQMKLSKRFFTCQMQVITNTALHDTCVCVCGVWELVPRDDFWGAAGTAAHTLQGSTVGSQVWLKTSLL